MGALILDVVETDTLASAIDAARKLGARTPLSQHTERMCRLVWQMRQAVCGDDWAAVEALLNAAATVLDECARVGREAA